MPDIKRHPTGLILAFLGLVLVVPLLAYSVIHLEGPRIMRDAQADLIAIGKLKADQIESWLSERRGDAEMLMASEDFIDEAERWFDHHDPMAESQIARRVAVMRRDYDYRLELLDAHARSDSPDSGRRSMVAAALDTGRLQMSDLYRDSSGDVWLDLVAPLVKPATGRKVGVVVLRTLADAFLFPLIQTWPTPSPSAETLLVRRDGDSVLFLNELRHRKGTALTLRLPLDSPDLPAAIATRAGGGVRTIEGRDYRGIPVLTAVRPVKGTAWFLVAKVDRDEVLRPLYKLVSWVSAVSAVAIIAVEVILLLLWRQQQRGHRLELLARTGERDRLLSLFFDLPFMGMAIIDPDDGHWLHINDRLSEMLGYSHEELLTTTTWEQRIHPDDQAACATEYRRMLAGETDGYYLEKRLLRKDGSPVDTALAVKCVRHPDGGVEYIVKTVRDISERKQSEKDLLRLNRALRAFSNSGWALVHAGDETAYLHAVCSIVVEDCGHAMAWVGHAEQDAEQSVRPVAQAGFDDATIDTLRLTWADRERGRDPTGTAIRGDRTVICHDLRTGPDLEPWREEALRRGFAACVALPISVDGKTYGAITIYSRLPDPFGAPEVLVLRKLADELAYGLGVLRLRVDRAAQQAALRESEARFRLLASATFEGIAITEQGRLVDANDQLLAMLGYAREELIGMPVADLLPAGDRERVLDNIESGRESHIEHAMLRRDGLSIQIEAHGQNQASEGRAIRITALRDITERKWAEDLIRRSQQQLYSFIEQAPIGIAMFDREMNYLAYSLRWLREYGRGHDDLAGRNHYAVHPDIGEEWKAVHRRGLAGETVRKDEDHWVQADGSARWLNWAVVPWRDQAGRIGGIIISADDITDRESAKRALADSRARMAGIIDSAMDAIITLDEDQRVRMFNPAAERMFGYQSADMLGEPIDRLIPVRLRQAHKQHLHRFAEEGVTSRGMGSLGELHALRSDGTEFPIEASISHVTVAGEQIFTVILRDVSARRRAQEALRYQLELIRGITEKSTDSIFVNDADGRVTAVNPEAERMFGYAAGELIGQVLHDVIHHHYPDGRAFPSSACPLCHVHATGEVIRDHETIVYRKDGSRLVVTGSNAALESDGKMAGAALVLHDITAIKQAEQALREREDDLTRAQAVAHIGSWRLDVRHNELTWSDENHRIFGIAEDTPLTYETFLSCVHPEDRAFVDREWQAGLRGEPYDIEHRLIVDGTVKWVREKAELEYDPEGNLLGGFGTTQDITDIKAAEQALRDSDERFQLAAAIGRAGTWDWNVRDGEVIWSRGHYEILGYRAGEVAPGYQSWIERVHPGDRAQIEAEIRRCMQDHTDYVAEFRVVWPDGSVHWMNAHGRYEYDEDGTCQRMLGVMADITSLKQAVLALREADQRKDEFLAMLAHELRNPLAPIRNAAHVLGRLDLDDPRVRWAQDIIERQVAHLTHLVDELLDIARIASGKISLKKTHIELADLARLACESVQPIMSAKGHRLRVDISDQPVTLDGDLVRLVQVLQNLLNNAAKYTPEGGLVELRGRRVGDEVEIRVSDNGMGIPADLLPGVFDLFRQGERTLDRSQGGLGIGLTLVYRLVELHGGRVEARSPGQGKGTTITVRLPAADPVATAALAGSGGHAASAERLRVLVVDDDPVVAESMVVFLELEGHQVRSAGSCEAALLLLAEFRPRVVLLDIGLPGEDGYEVARRIRQLPGGAELKLVAVTGYGHEQAVASSIEAGCDHHLVKPVDPVMLSALLAEIDA